MDRYYYFSVFPIEALIASQLEPEEFATYMAMGSVKGASERIIFIQVKEEFGDYFDWQYAREKCIPHEDGAPKHTLYLSVYRTLEHTDLNVLGSMYLTTRDGRSLELKPEEYSPPAEDKGYYLYQELCPITPLVVSTLKPKEFAVFITNPDAKIFVPKIVFADLKVIDFDNPEKTGNIGARYDRHIEHLKSCIYEVKTITNKMTKTLDRSHVEQFGYQIINHGIYIGEGNNIILYKMKTLDELDKYHREWARSAEILP